jgi:hypothetical protein
LEYRLIEQAKERRESVVAMSTLYAIYEEMRAFLKKLKWLQEPEPPALGTKLQPSYKPTRDHLEQA